MTNAQRDLLNKIAAHPGLSDRYMHTGTRTALERRGLIYTVEQFPNGAAGWTITDAGIDAL